MTARRPLFERCQGPGAIALDRLVEKADQRVAALQEEYGEDFQTFANNIESAAKAALAEQDSDDLRARLLAAILDGASSAAMAGYQSVSAIGMHLHDCLSQYGLQDPGIAQFVALHLDAMRGAAKWRAADWTKVLGELRQAAAVMGERHKLHRPQD